MLEARRTKPGVPPRWLVSMDNCLWELEMKKVSALERREMAAGQSGRVSDSKVG